MTAITIHGLGANVEAALRRRADAKGHSVEQEARDILAAVVVAPPDDDLDLAEAIRRRFAPLGGVDDLVALPLQYAPEPPTFDL